ncbi:MAG: hypothetical protein ACTHKQ_25790 [Mesorhizobium sp.]
MSLIGEFLSASRATVPEPSVKGRRKRPAPFSIRLSADERARLAIEAAGAPLSAYIKAKALDASVPTRARRSGLAVEDRTALAQALALLGRSEIVGNLAEMAQAVRIGSLPLTPETEAELLAALHGVHDMRRLLLLALGLKPEDGP